MKKFAENVEYEVSTSLSRGTLLRCGNVTQVKWTKLAGKDVEVTETWTHDTVKQALEAFPGLYALLNEE